MANSDGASQSASLDVDGATLRVSGALTKATVAMLLPEGRSVIAARAGRACRLELDGVVSSDSAGLALIVDWLRSARAHDVQLDLREVPEQLASLAAVSGLGTLVAGGTTDASG